MDSKLVSLILGEGDPNPLKDDGRLLRTIVQYHGRTLNASELGRRLNLSYHAVIRRIAALEQVKIRGTRFYCYGGLGRSQVDLIIDRAMSRIGLVFAFKDLFPNRDWACLKSVRNEEVIRRGFIIYPGRRCFFASKNIIALPATVFLNQFDFWNREELRNGDILKTIRHYNSEF